MTAPLAQRLGAEALGTAFLLATVVGSGIMAQKLAGGNVALALLGNTLPTGSMLVVLILIFGPLSGAHFNPAVSLAFAVRGELPWRIAVAYIAVQFIGAVIGVWAAHLMFDLPVMQLSTTVRTGPGQWLAEAMVQMPSTSASAATAPTLILSARSNCSRREPPCAKGRVVAVEMVGWPVRV